MLVVSKLEVLEGLHSQGPMGDTADTHTVAVVVRTLDDMDLAQVEVERGPRVAKIVEPVSV